jgi:hypothetical protein
MTAYAVELALQNPVLRSTIWLASFTACTRWR